MILKNPDYALTYFATHQKIQERYSKLMGYEFYFKTTGTSDLKDDYQRFKVVLEEKLVSKNKYKDVLAKFYAGIEAAMKKVE
jgi:hypothetical protein